MFAVLFCPHGAFYGILDIYSSFPPFFMSSYPQQPDQHRSILQYIARNVMAERGFLPEFSHTILDDVAKLTTQAVVKTDSTRDLRDLLWCSIDNDDSLDLDQLSVAIPVNEHTTRILVAIADVDALVPKGSPIDLHAMHNTTSVYTDAQNFPMLPLELSTNLTSLNFNEDRYAMIIDMSIEKDGSMSSSEIYQGIVKNHAKLAYNSVAAWLEDDGDIPEPIRAVAGLEANIRLQCEVSENLKAMRHKNGSLSFHTIKTRARFENEKVTELEIEKSNVAKNIIEEFMVAANGVTARFLHAHHFPSLRRIVKVPKRWDRIVELAATWDYDLPGEPDSKALDTFLRKSYRADSLRFPDLSLSVIKLLGPGEYVLEMPDQVSLGHFGLAIKDYVHSTAPNRRYPDLITQRLLKAALNNSPLPYTKEELEDLAGRCTGGEDEAKKVERQLTKSANAILMETKIGEKFDAIITGKTEHSKFVRVLYPPIEGKLMDASASLDVGDRVRVRLVHTDVEHGFIDFKEA